MVEKREIRLLGFFRRISRKRRLRKLIYWKLGVYRRFGWDCSSTIQFLLNKYGNVTLSAGKYRIKNAVGIGKDKD